MHRDWITCGLLTGSLFMVGCAGSAAPFARQSKESPEQATSFALAPSQLGESMASKIRQDSRDLKQIQPESAQLRSGEGCHYRSRQRTLQASAPGNSNSTTTLPQESVIQPANFQSIKTAQAKSIGNDSTFTFEGKTFQVELLDAASRSSRPDEEIVVAAAVSSSATSDVEKTSYAENYQLDLQSALAMVGGDHPAVGFAQWRVQAAYAQLDQAEVLWLPSLQVGFSFHRHDGNYQASNGQIVDVNRSSFQAGLGSGATGAGTTPRPGLVAQFHLKDAIFQPNIAEKTAWAHGHSATGVYQKQLLDVSLAYLKLINAEQESVILEESRKRTGDLAQLTENFATTGQGLRADADRMKTELVLAESRIAEVREQAEVASSRLARNLSLDATRRIVPLDPTVVPIELVSQEYDKAALISTGLAQRPELKEAQALVSAACDRYQREKYSPFVPSVLLGFSSSGFGGGVGTEINNVNDRYDFDALMTWEVRNLGLGEQASRREMSARVQQAKYEQIRVLDQVAQEISEAHSQVVHRRNRIEITQAAIESARNSFERNLSRIRDGQGLPIEVLQSIRALEDAHRTYLKAVIEYNEAQFRLQWSLGWPVFAPPIETAS